MVDELEKILFISLTFLTLLGAVSASEWSFDPLDEPLNQHDFAINTSSVFLTHLEDSEGNKIAPSDIANFEEGGDDTTSAPYVLYEYDAINESSGDVITINNSLSYHDNLDIWYAEFEPNYTGMDELVLRAKGDMEEDGGIDSQGEANSTIAVQVSNINTTLLRDNLELDFSQPVKADREDKFDVRTLNITDGTPLNDEDADVQVYFHNLQGIDSSYSLHNYNDDSLQDGGQYHFNAEVNTPEQTDSHYVLRINSETPEGEQSSEAFLIKTAPAINGQISGLKSGECDSQMQQCEPEAIINTEFDVTAAEAEAVNATVYGVNKTDGQSVNLSTFEMNEVEASDGVLQTFKSDIEIPDINTSSFEKGLELEFHAWNNERSYTETHDINLRSFTVQDRSNPTAFKGRTHEIRLLFGKHFSLDSYSHDRFDSIEVNLTGPDGFKQNYTAEDFEYIESDGVMTNSILISEEEESATYTLDIAATNIYGETKEFASGLNVRDVNATFAAQENLELEYSELGIFEESIELENLADADKTLEVDTDLEIIDISDSFDIAAAEVAELVFDVNMSSAENYDGEITFLDSTSNYNETTSISIEGPRCSIINNNICIDQDSITFSLDSSGTTTRTIGLTNLGAEELDLETSVTGNISDRVSLNQNLTLEKSETLDIVFETESPGNWDGELIITGNNSEASINVTADADFEASEPSISVSPSTIDIGTVPEGEEYSEQVTVQNTGDITVNDISVSSEDYNFSLDSFSLSSGDEHAVELMFESVQETTVLFAGQVSGQEVSTELTVEADILEDYSQRTGELSSRVSELRGQNSDTNLETSLTEVSAMVDQVNSQWDQGNYEEARTTFQDAQNRLDTIEADIQAQGSDGSGGDTGGTGSGTDEGGGFPVLPVIMIFFILAAIGGFVFYESYIPEEGDPLYGVLGE